VTNFNNGLEASSDSDDEDKLHIVEEDSLQEPDATANANAAVANGDQTTLADASHDASAVLAHNGSWNGGNPQSAPPPPRPQISDYCVCEKYVNVIFTSENVLRASVYVPILSVVGPFRFQGKRIILIRHTVPDHLVSPHKYAVVGRSVASQLAKLIKVTSPTATREHGEVKGIYHNP